MASTTTTTSTNTAGGNSSSGGTAGSNNAAVTATTTMQLEFAQAMADFKTMFPDMDKEVIEAVLRSNQGAVDATIDQLLTMSTDNQNEKLRNELEDPASATAARRHQQQQSEKQFLPAGPTTANIIDLDNDEDKDAVDGNTNGSGHIRLLSSTPLSPSFLARNTGASPKIKSSSHQRNATARGASDSLLDGILSCDEPNKETPQAVQQPRKWRPALLGPLPPGFLRLGNEGGRSVEFDIPDEQFALMLQNEEFMNELRWNPEFMCSLEKEQQLQYQQQQQHQQQQQQHHQKSTEDGGTSSADVAQFRERLRHMGKRSRKKFAMLARVFTWQRHKKPGAVRHPDSLPLREEHSDDDETTTTTQQRQQRGGSGSSRATKQ